MFSIVVIIKFPLSVYYKEISLYSFLGQHFFLLRRTIYNLYTIITISKFDVFM